MKKKMIVASILLVLVFVPQGFSKAKGYVKASLGGGFSGVTNNVTGIVEMRVSNGWPTVAESIAGPAFTLKPAGGVEWRTERANGNPGIFSFSLEASVGLGFGMDSNYVSVPIVAVDPGIMGIFSFHIWKFVPYVGLGFSVPMYFCSNEGIYFVKDGILDPDDFAYSFAGNLLLGFGFDITENIMPTLEIEGRLGFSPYTTVDFQARVGCMVRFGRW